MASEPPISPSPNGAPPGLPTVTPPTGSMFFRLFAVPALIVGGLVAVLLLVTKLMSGHASPEQFLRNLDSANKEVRWRAANDLAQVLLRDDDMASDVPFALQLTQRLRHTLDVSGPLEKAHAENYTRLSPEDREREQAKLDPDRNYFLLLMQCLSHFMVPVGAPVLEEMATQESGLDPPALRARRRQALWALANLGENTRRFDKLPEPRKEEVLARLESPGEHADWARPALDYLRDRLKGHPTAMGLDRVIDRCAGADDPSLRELAAFAANFWDGDQAESARIDGALVRLSNDAGKGEDELARSEEQKPPEPQGLFSRFVEKEPARSVVKKPGFRVQVNAAVALARRGSDKVRLDLLQAMLAPDELSAVFVVQFPKTGAEKPDEGLVTETLLNTLKAVAELHRKNPRLDLSSLRPNIDKLSHGGNPAVAAEAAKAAAALDTP